MSCRRVPERYSLSYGNSIFAIESQAVAFNIDAIQLGPDA